MRVVDRAVYERLRGHLERLYGEQALPNMLNRLDLLAGRYGVGSCPDEHCGDRLWDQNDAVLIAYGDMVQQKGESPLRTLLGFLENNLGDAFSLVHLLPFFPSSSADGFSVIDFRQVDPALGGWDDIQALGARYRLIIDLVINHVSSKSAWFRKYSNGIAPERHYFIEIDPDTDLSTVSRPGSSSLLRPVQTPFGERFVWATFSHDQIDLDFSNPDVLFELLDLLLFYVHKGARAIRLDAIAYLWKAIGTSCLNLQESHEVVKLLRDVLELLAPGITLLTASDLPHEENTSFFGAGDEAHMVYQVSLPAVLLHALETGESHYLTEWVTGLEPPPQGCTFLNFTASHDSIDLRPLDGLLTPAELDALAETMERKGGVVSRRESPDGSKRTPELDISYFDALSVPGQGDTDPGIARFLCSQIIMLSLQGVPGVYFNSLVGAPNWLDGVKERGRACAINRRKWDQDELQASLQDRSGPAQRLLSEYVRLLQIRREHPSFHPDGPQRVLTLTPGLFGIKRSAPDATEEVWVLANLTSKPLEVLPGRIDGRFSQREWVELIEGWTCPGASLGRLQIAPYQVMWLMG
jgi:sucrose phosphorylase